MPEGNLVYVGKSKEIYATADPQVVLIKYRDDATALDGRKKGIIKDKGIVNNWVSGVLFRLLEKEGIETHFLQQVDERRTLAKKLAIIPIEIVVRNLVAGSLAQRVGKQEGTVLSGPIIEFYYKNDDLHDPLINGDHARVMGWATAEQLTEMYEQATRINHLLKPLYDGIGIILVDFKLEFGLYEGRVVLGDEISPDTCRLWDKKNLEKMDKDRFRRDLGREEEAYQEVMHRIEKLLKGE